MDMLRRFCKSSQTEELFKTENCTWHTNASVNSGNLYDLKSFQIKKLIQNTTPHLTWSVHTQAICINSDSCNKAQFKALTVTSCILLDGLAFLPEVSPVSLSKFGLMTHGCNICCQEFNGSNCLESLPHSISMNLDSHTTSSFSLIVSFFLPSGTI